MLFFTVWSSPVRAWQQSYAVQKLLEPRNLLDDMLPRPHPTDATNRYGRLSESSVHSWYWQYRMLDNWKTPNAALMECAESRQKTAAAAYALPCCHWIHETARPSTRRYESSSSGIGLRVHAGRILQDVSIRCCKPCRVCFRR